MNEIDPNNPPGQPPIFKTEEDFHNSFRDYLLDCEKNKKMPNIAGFCAFNDMGRNTFYQYVKKFNDTGKKIDAALEDIWVNRLGGNSPTGAIFYLKNAFRENYKDRTETDITSDGKPIPIYGGLSKHNSDGKDIQPQE